MIFDYLPQLARIDGIKYCCSAFFLVTAIVSSNWDSVSTLLLKELISYIGDPDVIEGRKKENSKNKEGINSTAKFAEENLQIVARI